MEIHKPKPWRGWRELAKEVGTIVIGVLIALGAEQAVEWMHWNHEVEAERSSLLDEARNNLGAVAYRRTESACIERRLADLENIFQRQAQGRPRAIRAPLTTPPLDIESTSSWEIAVSGQALGHMPRKEKLLFSNAFDTYRAFNLLRNGEDAIWRRLQLVNHPDVLSPGDWVQLHQAFGEAEATNSRMATLTGYIVRGARLGQQPEQVQLTPADIAAMKTFCAPLIQ